MWGGCKEAAGRVRGRLWDAGLASEVSLVPLEPMSRSSEMKMKETNQDHRGVL